jgi:hypothetical protein
MFPLGRKTPLDACDNLTLLLGRDGSSPQPHSIPAQAIRTFARPGLNQNPGKMKSRALREGAPRRKNALVQSA